MAVITISKEFGCAGDYVAERVAEILNYKLINKEIIEYVSILSNTDKNTVENYDEEKHSTLKATISKYIDLSMFKDIFKSEDNELKYCSLKVFDEPNLFQENIKTDLSFDSERYKHLVDLIFKKLAQKGDVVLVGRGGQFILKDFEKCLHVRLVAPLSDRIKWVADSEKIDKKTAESKINEIEKKRESYIEHYYNEDIRDLSHYHMVVNLGKFSIQQAAEVIAASLKAVYPQ